jgi:nitrite reductase (cytochrome c-552)
MDALVALITDLKEGSARGIAEEQLNEARKLQRYAQFMLDFVEAENSMGFHAPQEAQRILAESIDLSRQGQLALRGVPVPGLKAGEASRPVAAGPAGKPGK